MFPNMEKDRTAASAKRSEKAAKADQTKHLVKHIPLALSAWNGLVTSITNDVNEFNNQRSVPDKRPPASAKDISNARFTYLECRAKVWS
jgi:hypothetical protein